MRRRSVERYSPGHLLPDRLAHRVARSRWCGVGAAVGEEDPPAVVGHLHRAVLRPRPPASTETAVRRYTSFCWKSLGPHLAPPLQETAAASARARALQRPVVDQVHVVGDFLGVVDGAHTRSPIEFGFGAGAVDLERARARRRRWGRLKIQFCHAVSRPETRASAWSPGRRKRRLASMPVSASGAQARALLDRDAHLVLPVDVVGGRGDEAERFLLFRYSSIHWLSNQARRRQSARQSAECRSPSGYAPKFSSDRAICGAVLRIEHVSCDRRRGPARKSVPAKQEPGSITANIERDETSRREKLRRRKPRGLADETNRKNASSTRSPAPGPSADRPASSGATGRCRG